MGRRTPSDRKNEQQIESEYPDYYFFWSGLEIRFGLFLSAGYVFSNRPAVAIFNIKVDFVTFSESLEAGHGDGSEMNEYVWTIFLLDEAVSSFLIEPFDDSFGQSFDLLKKFTSGPKP